MGYVTVTEVKRFTGMCCEDFRVDGRDMDEAELTAFVADMQGAIAQMIHRYCRVPTFDPTSSQAAVTEYHAGRGANDFDTAQTDYLPSDYQFYLRNLYYTGTYNGVTYAPLMVKEDVNPKTMPPAWVTRNPRPAPATYETDTLTIISSPTVNGVITIWLNGSYTYTVNITAGMSISQMCAAVIAAGTTITDLTGVVWTVTTDSLSVTWTAGITGPQNPVMVTITAPIYFYVTQNVQGNFASGGDYELITTDELTEVFFYNNIPKRGYNNILFTYRTGYDPGSAQYADIKMTVLRCFKNFVMMKKKIQEPMTIRAHGMRDYSTMFEPFNEEQILSDMEKIALNPYVRFPLQGPMYD